MPAVLCTFKPFQGYGPPHQYIDYFTPLVFLFNILLLFYNWNFASPVFPSLQFFLLIGISIDTTFYSIASVFHSYRSYKAGQLLSNLFSRPFESFAQFFRMSYEQYFDNDTLSLMSFILSLKSSSKIRIGILETHLQLSIQAFVALKNFSISNDEQKIVMAVPMIDSATYGFYSDYSGFSNTLSSLRKCKVNTLILNLSIPYERSLAKQYQAQNKYQLHGISGKYLAVLMM